METKITCEKEKIKTDKILIEIASYCDPELLNTVNSAIMQADNPDRVYFSICYQGDNLKDYDILKQIKNCKIKYLSETESKGACYARYLCQDMIEDETYIYQIDSHMRFVKHWDTKMIENLLSLNDPKAIISFYPPNCPEEVMKLPLDDAYFDNPTAGGIMYTNGFQDEQSCFLKTRCLSINKDDPRIGKKNALISAGNFFTFSEAHKVVKHDPEMYFYGDELPMSIRLFTHGWNVYNFGESYIYHQYLRKSQKFSPVKDAMPKELTRFKKLVVIDSKPNDLGEFGLGTKRTLSDYEKFSGIDFKNRKVYMNAELGEFENKDLRNKISYIAQKREEQNNELKQKNNIEIIIIDLFGEYQECIDSCLSNADNKNNIKFIIGTNKNHSIIESQEHTNNIKELICFKNNESYSEILYELSQLVGNCYLAIIDSSVRFLKGWDTYLCKNIKLCGKKSALTSWVWKASEETDIKMFSPYNNVVKEFDNFVNYLPVLRYNQSIDLTKKKYPYQTPFISDGLLFYHSSILKQIPFDPNLSYNEQKYIYSVRLWTNGINIYYPSLSHFVRTKEEELLNNGKNNYEIICSLLGMENFFSKKMEPNYPYDIGKERPLWTFYDFINYDITPYNE